MPGRLVLLATSPRVAAGLVSFRAWSALTGAVHVLAEVGETSPLVDALGRGSIGVEQIEPRDLDAVFDACRDGDVVVVTGDQHSFWVDAVVERISATEEPPELEIIQGSWDLPGSHLLDVVAVMDRLRSPGGCPWDAKQTHESLVEYLVEEAYEAVEAIETADDDELREELGDVLLQVLVHARIAQEHDAPWSIDDVADGITSKLVSRHPHVFGDVDAVTAEQVEANWKVLKAAEKGRESVTDGIPSSLPALVLAAKLLRRSADVEDVEWVVPGVEAAAERALEAVDGDVGDLLLALVGRLAATDLDAEQELRASVRRLRTAVREAEGLPAGPSEGPHVAARYP